MQNATPKNIKLHRRTQILEVVYEIDGEESSFNLSAEYLRVFTPSAEVRGHGGGDYDYPTGKERVAITNIEPQGNYGIKLHFSDGHNSGIFTWQLLKELGENFESNWEKYLAQLHERNKTRDPDTQGVKFVDP